jgi:predicted transcriptional regulator
MREKAPTLVAGRKLRVYAIFGSVLMVLTVAAFYFAMQIYEAVSEDRAEASLIEVEQAPEIKESETSKALARIEEEQKAAEKDFEERVQALQQVDLLSDDSAGGP